MNLKNRIINRNNLRDIKNCESKRYEKFAKGDTILSLSGGNGMIGLLLEGQACIVSIDENGHESISDFLTAGDSFGEYIFMPLKSLEYIVVADCYCEVMFVNFENIIKNCRYNCENHNDLMKKMLQFTAQRAKLMSLHVTLLSQKTLRGKLLMYFEYLRVKTGSEREVIIPTTFERLSSYLGADRSALMREIRRMNDDGVISSKGKRVIILNPDGAKP